MLEICLQSDSDVEGDLPSGYKALSVSLENRVVLKPVLKGVGIPATILLSYINKINSDVFSFICSFFLRATFIEILN